MAARLDFVVYVAAAVVIHLRGRLLAQASRQRAEAILVKVCAMPPMESYAGGVEGRTRSRE